MNQTFVYIQYIHVLGCGTCPWTEILRLFNMFFDFVIACLHSFFLPFWVRPILCSLLMLASTSEQWLIDFLQGYRNAANTMKIVVLKRNIGKQKQKTLTQNYIRPEKSTKTSLLMMVVSLTRCLRTCLKFWAQLLVKPFHPWFLWTHPWFSGL